MMNAADEAINSVYRQLGCLACAHWRADIIKARIGAVFLAVERGEKVSAPTRDRLLVGCCQRGDDTVITFGAAQNVMVEF